MYTSFFRKAMLGDTATLNLDFTTGTLDSRFTFTRASTATYVDSAGLVQTMAAAASNDLTKARYTYSGGTCLGLMIEAEKTNILTYTKTLALTPVGAEQYWVESGIHSRSSITGPDGVASSAVGIVAIGVAATLIASAAAGSSALRTFSFYANNTGGNPVEYTLDNGTSWVSVSLTAAWQRFTITSTTAAQRVGFRIGTTGTTGIWGVQLEAGKGSTSYISTTSAQATRSADVCRSTSISTMQYSTTNGTLLLAGILTQENAASYPNRCGFMATGDNITMDIGTNTTSWFGRIQDASINTELTKTLTLNVRHAVATTMDTSLSTGELKMCLNGGAVTASGATAMTATRTPTIFDLGRYGYDQYIASGTIEKIKYYPTTFTSAELQALTA
jgi:hypothetical protein